MIKISQIMMCLLMMGIQIIQRLESFHEKGFLHRDIKLENFNIGNCSLIYMIDFSLSNR